eukprot:gene31471-38039_t
MLKFASFTNAYRPFRALSLFANHRKELHNTNHVVVLGSGAVGLSYGLQLLDKELKTPSPNLNLSFVARRDHKLISAKGVRLILDDEKEVRMFPPAAFVDKVFRDCYEVLQLKGQADWLIVCCKTTALNGIQHEIQALSHKNTKVLLIMNGLGMEDAVGEYFPHHHIFGAVAYIGANRGPNPPTSPGPLEVQIYKLLNLEIGHYLDDPSFLQESMDLWRDTPIASKVLHVPNLLKARWSKLCWNLAFSGIAVAMGGLTTDVIVEDAGLAQLADDIITESIHVANADISRRFRQRQQGKDNDNNRTINIAVKEQGPPSSQLIDVEVHRQRLWLAGRTVGKYKASTVLDLVEGKELEMRYMYSEVLRRAQLASESQSSLQYSRLAAVLQMVEAMGRIASKKKELGIGTVPTLFTS